MTLPKKYKICKKVAEELYPAKSGACKKEAQTHRGKITGYHGILTLCWNLSSYYSIRTIAQSLFEGGIFICNLMQNKCSDCDYELNRREDKLNKFL